MSRLVIDTPATDTERVVNYIQTTLKAYAQTRTRWCYDTDDFVQETALRFLSHDYSDRSLLHQRRTAKRIMDNLFRVRDLQDVKLRVAFQRMFDTGSGYEPPEATIDMRNLMMFMKERENKNVNIFWLYYIGYTIGELTRMFEIDRADFHSMVQAGKQLMRRHLKANAVETGVKLPAVGSCQTPDQPAREIKTRRKTGNPVNQFTMRGQWIREWFSPMFAQQHFGPGGSLIRSALRGSRKSAYGFLWSFEPAVGHLVEKSPIPFVMV